jgi:hypothetical protein
MSFVDHFCPISGSGLSPAHCRPFCLSSLCLWKVCLEISSLLLHPSPLCFLQLRPFCCVLVFSFFFGGVILPRGLCWFIPGVVGGITHNPFCSPVWSAECLPSRFGAVVWWRGSPPVFAVWRGIENLSTGYGFRVSKFWFSLVLCSIKCGSSVSARFFILGAHDVCFCLVVVTILHQWYHFLSASWFYLSVGWNRHSPRPQNRERQNRCVS